MHTTIGIALGELKRRAGLSLNAIARAAGYSGPSSVQAYFHPDYDPPGLDISVAHKLLAAFEGKGAPPISAEDVFDLVRIGGERSAPIVKKHDRLPWLDPVVEINVYETRYAGSLSWSSSKAEKSLEAFDINMERQVRVFPPQPGLGRGIGAFAIFVAGDSMSPKYRDGDPIFVDPIRSATLGGDAIVILKPGPIENPAAGGFNKAILGVLVDRTDTDIEILQHKAIRTARIESADIISLLRVIPWSEVTGASYA